MKPLFKILPVILVLLIVLNVAFVFGKNDDTFSFSEATELKGMSTVEYNSNRHTQYDTPAGAVNNILNLEGFEKKLESETLEIWFREKTKGIRIVDKRNGYVWGGLKGDEAEDLNDTWADVANSLCTVEYFNDVYAEKRTTVADSKAKCRFKWEKDSLNCYADFPKLSIAFSFTLSLENDEILVSFDKNSLKEGKENHIKALYFLPFLGCSHKEEVNGYSFVPDGSGALIRYQASGSYVNGFEGKIYGLDMGIDALAEANDLQANRTNDYLVDSPQVTMPIFGLVHGAGQNAILGIVEGGAENAYIISSVAGSQTDYYWTTARFDYRQIYVQKTGSDGSGVYKAQEKPVNMTPAVRYCFLNGDNADYSGMAVTYREYLQNKKILNEERVDKEIPLRLNVVGAEIKKGVLFNTTSLFTTVNQAEAFVKTLSEKDINNLTLVYDGWQDGGINGSEFMETDFENKLGSKGDFEKLRDRIASAGGRFYLSQNPVTANKDQINLKRNVAINKSNVFVRLVRPNTKVMYYETYFVKPSMITAALDRFTKGLKGFDLSIAQIGMRLYADYTRNAEISRAKAKDNIIKSVKSLSGKTAMSQVNQYLWKYTDEYFDIPTVSSQYLFETDNVPFLQIVLKGSIDYYAPFANQGFFSQTSILKMIEYGCYPSFMVTAEDNYSLTDTPLEDYFSLNFNDWLDMIIRVYKPISEALSQVEGQYVTSHKMISDGVAQISYSNGTVIYVNYNESDYNAAAGVVPARSYLVKG